MSQATVADLFEMAIRAELIAEELYRRLAKKFAHHPEVADFWVEYANEEAQHAAVLRRIRDSLEPEALSSPADPTILHDAQLTLQFSVDHAIKGVKNLEHAYQLVDEVENSETNAVFDFLISNFSSDERAQAFLRAQLTNHIRKLMIDFPTRFHSTSARLQIKAQE